MRIQSIQVFQVDLPLHEGWLGLIAIGDRIVARCSVHRNKDRPVSICRFQVGDKLIRHVPTITALQVAVDLKYCRRRSERRIGVEGGLARMSKATVAAAGDDDHARANILEKVRCGASGRPMVIGLIHIHVEDVIPCSDLLLGHLLDISAHEVPKSAEGDEEANACVVLALSRDRWLFSDHHSTS